MNPGWAILSTHYLNAWGLADLIRSTGWAGRVVCLQRASECPVLMRLYGRGVEVWTVPEDAELVPFLAKRIPMDDRKWFFFTEERSLEEISAARHHPWLATATWYPDDRQCLPVILDRFRFYDLITSKGLGNVPRTISGERDPFSELGATFFFRYRLGWINGKQTPRVHLVTNRTEWQAAIRLGRSHGYGPSDWCYQEKLSLVPKDNVSICGWHDSKRPMYVATRKVLQFPERQGNGDVCEMIQPRSPLPDITRKLLDELRYTGPFELEFVLDSQSGEFSIIELNPRFWMQHPLAGANLNQALVRLYLGLPFFSTPSDSSPARYWVNTIVALNRLLHADFRGWKYLRDPQAIRMPPMKVTIRWLPRISAKLLRRKFSPL